MKWKAFYFDGNHAWGRIYNEGRWHWLIDKHLSAWDGLTDGEVIERLMNARASRLPDSFGFYEEYNEPKTLREFFDENGMDNGIAKRANGYG